jgi:transcription antitermination factor NusG
MPWYALQVRHQHEHAVAGLLRGKGYLHFLPTWRCRRRWCDRTIETDAPLFPGYVFVQFDPFDRRLPVVTTPGVIRIVGVPRGPLPVDDAEIAAIQKVAASGAAAGPWPYVTAGQPVRIRHGALAGVEGILLEVKNRRRLIVSVSLLQRSIHVDIDSADVTPV